MSQGTLSDFGSAFSSGFNNGRQRYGNTMTHFSDDGRLVTNRDDVSFPHQNRRLPDVPDYRSYDAGRERRRGERYRTDNWRDRENARERERELRAKDRDRDFYSPGNHASAYPSDLYGGGRGVGARDSSFNPTPVYGRTLPLPMNRDVGPPVRRYDDFRSREMRPNYERSGGPRYDRSPERPTYDWRMPMTANKYDQTGLVASRNYGGRFGVLANTKRTKWSERPMGWYFIIAGLFLLLSGLVNLTICRPNYYYCFIWLSVLTIELGVLGVWHGGRFKDHCKNIYYIGTGTILVIAAMVCSGLVFYEYIPLVKTIASYSNHTAYYVVLESESYKPFRIVKTSDRVWTCLVFDSIGLVFTVADYMALYAVILVAHRYWNYRMRNNKPVEPFCRPMLFNPFMEMIWGEVLVLLGMLSRFGCYGTEWHWYLTGIWAGAFVIITGAISSTAAKLTNQRWTAGLAIFMNFIGIAACVVCITLNCLGIYDNITALQKKTPGLNRDYLVASALILAFVLAVALICFFYCLGLMVRFSYYLTRSGFDRDALTTSSRSDQTASIVPPHRYGYDKERGFDISSDNPPLPYRTPRPGIWGRRY